MAAVCRGQIYVRSRAGASVQATSVGQAGEETLAMGKWEEGFSGGGGSVPPLKQTGLGRQ